ncbi:hypothetical protein FACS1894107_11190 [Planctomycetales bacterium]|nr:hypothetical protein FACS1894107_11190 [Planctomycetales bacterium]
MVGAQPVPVTFPANAAPPLNKKPVAANSAAASRAPASRVTASRTPNARVTATRPPVSVLPPARGGGGK